MFFLSHAVERVTYGSFEFTSLRASRQSGPAAGAEKSKALSSNLRQLVGNEFTVVIHRYRLNSMK